MEEVRKVLSVVMCVHAIEIVGKADTGEEAVALARKVSPDVLIMQVDEKVEKAKDTLSQIFLDSTSPPKVIILTMFENPRILREVMKLGPNTFVHKSASVEELLSSMRTTIGGHTGENVVMLCPKGRSKCQKTSQQEGVSSPRES